IELEEAASARRDVNDRSERPDAAADLGGGAWQRHDGDAEMPGSAHAGTTPTGPHPSGRHGAGLSGGVRPEVAPQPCRDGSVPCGYYHGNQDPHKSLQPIRSSNSRSRLPRDQRSTTESTEIHGKENPNQLPLSVSFRSTNAQFLRALRKFLGKDS